jgi:hypothetical protein
MTTLRAGGEHWQQFIAGTPEPTDEELTELRELLARG